MAFGSIPRASPAFTVEFHLRDHLGNTRVVMEKVKVEYKNIRMADYYPFGMQIFKKGEIPPGGNLLSNRFFACLPGNRFYRYSGNISLKHWPGCFLGCITG